MSLQTFTFGAFFLAFFLANAGKGKWKVKIAGLNQKNICIVNP
jgi:hypothetical protein